MTMNRRNILKAKLTFFMVQFLSGTMTFTVQTGLSYTQIAQTNTNHQLTCSMLRPNTESLTSFSLMKMTSINQPTLIQKIQQLTLIFQNTHQIFILTTAMGMLALNRTLERICGELMRNGMPQSILFIALLSIPSMANSMTWKYKFFIMLTSTLKKKMVYQPKRNLIEEEWQQLRLLQMLMVEMGSNLIETKTYSSNKRTKNLITELFPFFSVLMIMTRLMLSSSNNLQNSSKTWSLKSTTQPQRKFTQAK